MPQTMNLNSTLVGAVIGAAVVIALIYLLIKLVKRVLIIAITLVVLAVVGGGTAQLTHLGDLGGLQLPSQVQVQQFFGGLLSNTNPQKSIPKNLDTQPNVITSNSVHPQIPPQPDQSMGFGTLWKSIKGLLSNIKL